MAYVIFVVCLAATFFVRMKVVHWRTIALLGFSIDTPEPYMRHPRAYNCVSWVLVFALVGTVSWFTEFALWIRVTLFVIVVYVGEMEGKLKAVDDYRRNLRATLEEQELDADEREAIWRELSKSGPELVEEARRRRRFMAGKL